MLRKFINSLHIHFFVTPIHSRYWTFGSRKIIYECRCGCRQSYDVRRNFGDAFPIPTSMNDDCKMFKNILNNTLSDTDKIMLAIDYKVVRNPIGKRYYHLLPDSVKNC